MMLGGEAEIEAEASSSVFGLPAADAKTVDAIVRRLIGRMDIVQARIAYEQSNGRGRIHMNVLWEMAASERVLHGVLEGAKGLINGVSLQVQIVPLGNNIFTFKAEGKGGNLTGLTNPVTVVLTIGIDSGTTNAEFQKS